MRKAKRLSGALLGLAFAFGVVALAPALAQRNVTVVANGSAIGFDQPPVLRAGRVFVPLRGVFERLGATVVYANGDINAQGNGRDVHLHIGQTQATVNGQSVYMDVAPFLVGARTLVPLRFVAQALGATVNWDASNSTVYIKSAGGTSSSSTSYTPQPSTNASFYLKSEHPGNGGHVNSLRPVIRARYSEAVRRDTLALSIDGRDVTGQVYSNANGFEFVPNFDLSSGTTHNVVLTGTTQAGATFRTGWSFTTANGSTANFINNMAPTAGSKVGSSFTLSGHTLPNSAVHIVAAASANAFGGLLQLGTGSFQTDVRADSNGNFSAPISLNAVSGGQVKVIVTSTSPAGSAYEQPITYSS